jgi:hypothetical protein
MCDSRASNRPLGGDSGFSKRRYEVVYGGWCIVPCICLLVVAGSYCWEQWRGMTYGLTSSCSLPESYERYFEVLSIEK